MRRTRSWLWLSFGLAAVLLILLGFSLYSAFNPPSKYKGKPLPAQSTRVNRTFREALLQCYRRNTIEAFRYQGQGDADIRALLEGYARWCAGFPDAPSPEEFAAHGKAAMKKGCTDPLALLATGEALLAAGDRREGIDVLQRAASGFSRSKYPAFCSTRASMLLLQGKPHDGSGAMEISEHQAADLLKKALQDGSFRKEEPRQLLYLLREFIDMDPGIIIYLLPVVLNEPNVDPYVRDVLQALAAVKPLQTEASYPVQKLSWDRWRGCLNELESAYAALKRAWKAHPEFPEAPALMISVANAKKDWKYGAPRQWFDRAVQAELDYLPAYEAYWRSDIVRGWQRNELPGHLYNFGLECLNTNRYDTQVPFVFIRIARAAPFAMDHVPLSTRRMPGGPENPYTILARYIHDTTGREQLYYLTYAVAFAYSQSKFETARKFLNQVGDRIDRKLFAEVGNEDFGEAREAIYALSGDLGVEIATIRRTKDTPEQIDTYKRLIREGHINAYAVRFLQKEIIRMQLEDKNIKAQNEEFWRRANQSHPENTGQTAPNQHRAR